MRPDSEIVKFWLGASVDGPATAEAQRERWYRGGESLDAEIAKRFGALVEQALEARLTGWGASHEGALALVILLDQFTRHIHRGTPRAYAGDALALTVADDAIASGLDRALPITGRLFLYHPFHHAETLAEQERGVRLLASLEQASPAEWRDYVRRRVEGFGSHRDIVARFGRFPHRNEVLGRVSTPEEIAFMQADAESFGQGRRPR